jgi:undecaprenyl-diphosphatase
MTTVQSIIISVVEGLTEFLPISSTAHMKFTNPLVGVDAEAPFTQMFEVVIQLAAILAVVVLYRKKFFNFKKISFYIKLIVAVIPALIAGVLLKSYINSALGNLTAIACIMIGGGVLLLFIDKLFTANAITEEEKITNKSAFVIGCFQVLSVLLPGLSRSAATIIGGMSQKLTHSLAAEFSFFLAVPTMLAASAKSCYDACKDNYFALNNIDATQAKTMKVSFGELLGKDNLGSLFNHDNTIALIIGCVVSFVVALLAIRFFIGFVKKYGFKMWGVYRIIVGIIMLLLIWKGVIS